MYVHAFAEFRFIDSHYVLKVNPAVSFKCRPLIHIPQVVCVLGHAADR